MVAQKKNRQLADCVKIEGPSCGFFPEPGYRVILTLDHQSFRVGWASPLTEKEARWLRKNLLTALSRL